ncbi:hypothetical protein GCM10022223_47360 [Kineosporia mesophila]|uniref:HTH-like domain-containing protein n=1 Tax=Kineosporia mesophila TaxID=566012 RepID=A0ABP7A4H4_9ACTN
MIIAYIDEHKDRFGIEPICRLLSQHGIQIAPSTYHARRTEPVIEAELGGAYAVNTLLDLHRANRGVHGSRTGWHALRRAGHVVGRDQVARLMRIAGVEGIRRGKHHTITTQGTRKRPETQISSTGSGMRPRPRISGGSRISFMYGRWPGSFTYLS